MVFKESIPVQHSFKENVAGTTVEDKATLYANIYLRKSATKVEVLSKYIASFTDALLYCAALPRKNSPCYRTS